jgi:hypothetical protein
MRRIGFAFESLYLYIPDYFMKITEFNIEV